ncbi:glycerophosphodiester phosphodiesterase [Halovivax sp.]|uniref:glycerophosphodiester phosphodiesterase n=1 Tax=Halovivax sp. TaxID=1935978 RepID=UPI0025C3A6A3|nr:glycerophosphodiester phosphodiesterase family protein [Halovivax sp.]
MRLIAHRGFAAVAPENTIAAIESAGANGADAVEFDVRRCGSGELVVVHDETIDRVTDGSGAVSERSLAELRSHRVDASDERIPTLAATLEALPPGIAVNCELKERGLAADVLATLDAVDPANRVVLTSFLHDELRRVRELDPERPTGLLARRELRHPVTTAVELGCSVLAAKYWRFALTRLPERAAAVDLELHAWGTPNAYVARALGLRGVDAVSSDRPLSL